MERGFAEAGRRDGEAAGDPGAHLELATYSLCAGTNHILSQGLSFPIISLSISFSLMGHLCSCPHPVQNPPLWPGPCCLFPGAAQALLTGLLASGLALTVWAPLRGQRDLLQPNSVTSPRCSKAVTPHLMQVKPSLWPLLSDPTLPAELPLPTAWNSASSLAASVLGAWLRAKVTFSETPALTTLSDAAFPPSSSALYSPAFLLSGALIIESLVHSSTLCLSMGRKAPESYNSVPVHCCSPRS